MNFISERAHGVTREQFIKAVQAEGLPEFEAPNSTRPIHTFPLFKRPGSAVPSLYEYNEESENRTFPHADEYFASAIKLPVWAHEDEARIVEGYLSGVRKVAHALLDNPEPLRAIKV